jgi:hypothetical protein
VADPRYRYFASSLDLSVWNSVSGRKTLSDIFTVHDKYKSLTSSDIFTVHDKYKSLTSAVKDALLYHCKWIYRQTLSTGVSILIWTNPNPCPEYRVEEDDYYD